MGRPIRINLVAAILHFALPLWILQKIISTGQPHPCPQILNSKAAMIAVHPIIRDTHRAQQIAANQPKGKYTGPKSHALYAPPFTHSQYHCARQIYTESRLQHHTSQRHEQKHKRRFCMFKIDACNKSNIF